MKRDIDLVRQLLLDVERFGGDCPIDALRTDLRHDSDERIRHHVRLLIESGWLQEVDRPAVDAPCVRLTHAGQEFIEVCRSTARWRDAKAAVIESTGGLSLTVLRALLTEWAWQSVVRNERRRRVRRARRLYYDRLEPQPWLDTYGVDNENHWDDDQVRLVRRRRPDYRERFEFRNGRDGDLYHGLDAELADVAPATLPEELI